MGFLPVMPYFLKGRMRRFVQIRFPSPEEVLDINKTYYSTYKKCRADGILTRLELERYLEENGLFTEIEETTLKNIESGPASKYRKIKAFEDESMERRFIESKMIEIMLGYKVVDLLELNMEPELEEIPEDTVYRELAVKKNSYIKYSAESIAENEKNNKLIYYCCYINGTEKRLWSSFEEFLNETNKYVINILLREVSIFLSGFHQTILRKIARNVMWRTRWISSTKTGSQLFKGLVSDWDTNKSMLCYWSNFYDSIYSLSEKPEEFVVNDDEFLDNWLEGQNKRTSAPDPDKDTMVGTFKTKINPIKKGK